MLRGRHVIGHTGGRTRRSGPPPLLGAFRLLARESDGLALSFVDQSANVKDTVTMANAYNSQGFATAGGDLIGPAGLITYSSPSAKMCRQADGLLKYGAHNLYLNSASPADQAITVLSGHTYAITITGTVSITWSGAYVGTTTAGTTTFTAASGTLTGGSTSGSGTVHVYKTPAVSTYVATAGAAVYQLPYTYDINGDCEGILVEGQSTNLFQRSSEFENVYWADYQLTHTANAAIAPDGTTTADKATPSVASDVHTAFQKGSLGLAGSTVYTFSVYAKAAGNTWIRMNAPAGLVGVFTSACFNLETGAVGTTTGTPTTAVEEHGDGWYRCSVTFTTVASPNTEALSLVVAEADGDVTFAGDGTSGIYIWGAQLEALAFPTSYIPTVGATVTRAADSGLTMATSLYPHSAAVGTAMVRYKPRSVGTAMVALRLDDGTANEVISIGHSAAAAIGLTVTDGGAAQTAPLTDGTATVNTFEKLAASWKANDFLFSDNGAAAVTDTSGTLPTVTSIDIGPTLTGIISHVLVLPVEKSAAEVAEIAS